MDGERLTHELRTGSALAGERLPTPGQCAGQLADYERFAADELHISHPLDRLMEIIQQRVAKRRERQRLLGLSGCGRRMQQVAALAGPQNRKDLTHGSAELAQVPSAGESAPGDTADQDVRGG